MVERLYLAVKEKRNMYFWHPDNNLIENVRPTLLATYETKLKEVLDAIDANDVEKVVKYLLTTDEMTKFKASEFYVRVSAQNKPANSAPRTSRLTSNESSSSNTSILAGVKALNDELDSISQNSFEDKITEFQTRLSNLEDRMQRV